ncbi:efflux RND transporter periplasmic adaptor subunit [Brevibacillus centrosporus]|jgi:multidrug efflux pump subunit AcrA (membrane-fusion protein)|uniref:RND family efflux transporter, MFP subunit n=1 Tax=Brevibacillus centrosporus TaxID=54910 RepID=A0A1I3L731_9BACL|nr:efflux RND transporter periplasmic adaptor subunit [Brevibacillus centrosporus]MEC2130147.1 efflux RND transporter periplasmic adaptor subunit [Brevibacillus centrosporus]MED1951028.1 efflux RND transporter periplasmic adaptor subunit [Brevibacillus centrosporus]MED4907051.1 efflux RND transporter periplasmic adaptor subunit [Brevibacillus centrosporus]RNB66234.1 efflux RND transporter periplasmic adaptor subunit [Brevibacillus centrosporus]SFI80521.1 RND family efflux transporter, MFP subu
MKNKHWKTIGAVLTAVSLITAGCSEASSGTTDESVPVVKTWKVTSTQTGVIASGKITAAEEIQVVSKVSGKAAAVNANEGSVVKQGDVLVTLEASEYQQQIVQAQAAIAGAQAKLRDTKAGARNEQLQQLASTVEQAKASLKVAESTYNRMKALFDSGALSAAELEKTTLDLEKARTTLDQMQAQYDLAKAGPTSDTVAALQAEVSRLNSSLELAKTNYDNTIVRAPITGIVAKRNVDPGEMAAAGSPLLVLVKMDEVKVEASVPQEQINNVKVGSTVDVKVSSLGGKVLKGNVEFVSPISDANSSSFPVKVRVPNQDGQLRAGMVAEVMLQGQAEQGTKVPSTAVLQKDGKQYIYTVDNDVVHQVEVTVSGTNGDWATVAAGVNDNDQVVLNPTDKLAEGTKVIAN